MLSGFSCGARRFDKYKFTTDKPSNPTLHKENEQKLNDLLRIREEQDNRVFAPITFKSDVTATHINSMTIAETFAMPEQRTEYAAPTGQGPSVQRTEYAAPKGHGPSYRYRI
jgi:hypothetical protein